MLVSGLTLLGTAPLAMGGVIWRQDVVKLGKGIASVYAQPIASLQAVNATRASETPEPTPSGLGGF